jgi:uncharacterized protein DUF222
MPADHQDSAAPAVPGQDRPRLLHPAPADPASAVLAAGGRNPVLATDDSSPVLAAGRGNPVLVTDGRNPDCDQAEPDDPFGDELDELDGCTEAEPGPVRAVRAAFALGHPADGMSPGAVLASLSEQAWQHGLAGLDEDQLTGMLQAADRLAAWSAALRLAAVSQLAGRRQDAAQRSGDGRVLEHVRDEIAMTLTLTGWGADRLLGLAVALDRLPLTQAALASGAIDERRADVIASELAGLGDEHAAAVEARLLPRAATQTTAQLRQAARRAVLAADPAAARRRKDKAAKDTRVEVFTEAAGTAALAGRDLPPAAVLAADTNLTSLALDMRSAGAEGTLDQLRARAYLHLLSGQPAAALTSAPPAPSANPGPPRPGAAPGRQAQGTQTQPPAGKLQAEPGLPAMRGVIHLTLPLATWLGWSQAPGEAAGYGPLDADDSRTVAAMLAAHPATTWCVTLTGPTGRPVAHGCAGTRPGPAPPRAGPRPAPHRAGPGAAPSNPLPDLPSWLSRVKITPLQTVPCTHPREGRGYQPGPTLRHLIQVRNPTCTAPGCRRPAQRCDLDHTTPHHLGGRTCECNLGPSCKR